MKKYFLLLSFSLVILGTSHVASATSGACSSHGGVNCSVGMGSLGANAICNDGYESSTSYYDTGECVGNLSSCSQPIKSYCSSASDYAKHCGTPSQYTSDMYDACHADCESQINKYQSDLATYNSCISQQPQVQSSNTPTQSIQQIIQQQQDQQKASDLLLKQAEDKLKQTELNASCGVNSTFDQTQNKCICQLGYFTDSVNSLCEPLSIVCFDKYGINSHSVSGNCACNEGYEGTSGTCVAIQISNTITTSKTTGYQGMPKEPPKQLLDNIFATTSIPQNNKESSSTISTSTPQQAVPSFWNNFTNFIKHLNPFSWF